MSTKRRYRIVTLVALVALAGCGGDPTNTPAIPTAPATMTAVLATATGLASANPQAVLPASPVASAATRPAPGTATPLGTADAAPPESVRLLLQGGNFRLRATLAGFTLANRSGELVAEYDVRQEDRRVVITSGGQRVLDAYRIGPAIYQAAPGGGYQQIVDTDPNIEPLRRVFSFPEQLLQGLFPATATFTATGADTTSGIVTTAYAGTVSLADASIVDRTRQGQAATAATILQVAIASGYPVVGDADITLGQGGTAKAHFTIADVGQVGPITRPPGT